MGRSGKSRSRKSDKETQSPMLKIFKDIMQRENDDPEKINLLKAHHEDRKKKQYSESKTKSDLVTVESSGSERCKRTVPYTTHEQRNLEYEQDKTQSTPFQSNKKESWWLWGDNEKAEREESCSCVSCALKKLAGSEFMCVGCLLTVFTLSVVVAFLLVFRSVPTITADETELRKFGANSDSERLKRKIDQIKERRDFNLDLPSKDKKSWDYSILRPLDGLSAISDDFALPNIQGSNNLEIGSRSAELTNVLGGNNVFELQNSDRLRDFYRKLIQTDAQINMLKKGVTDFTLLKTDDEKLKTVLYRTKRSFNIHKLSNIGTGKNGNTRTKGDDRSLKVEKMKQNLAVGNNTALSKEVNVNKNNEDAAKNTAVIEKYKINVNNRDVAESYPGNRDVDFSDEGNTINDAKKGIVIEKNKLLVKYKLDQHKKVPKCSHAPKETKSHEKQLKHPFYKNTQRLDEMLDRFMEKGLPGILADSFGADLIVKNKCKHPNVDDIKVMDKDHVDKTKAKSQASRDMNNNDIYEFTTQPRVKITTTNEYDVVLSISTLLSPEFKRHEDMTSGKYLNRGFNYRKLMQIDEENLGHEDLKEVFTDDLEDHGDMNNHGERPKRNENSKYQSPDVYNQNWKGSLFPDNIKSMIENAALSANNPGIFKTYEAETGHNTKDAFYEAEESKDNVGDVQYMEDYLINKYDKLHQAYSDYGVLAEKKESVRNEKDEGVTTADHRVKLFIDRDFLKGGFFDRLKKSTQPSEGIRFEVRPSGSSQIHREDKPLQVYKYIQKHIKMAHDNSDSPLVQALTTWPTSEELELMYTPKPYDETHSFEKSQKKYKNDDSENGLIFAISKGTRSLKSIVDDGDLNEYVQNETNIFNYKDNINAEETKEYDHGILNINQNVSRFDKHFILKRELEDNTIYSKNRTISYNETSSLTNFNINQNTTTDKEKMDNQIVKNYNPGTNISIHKTDRANDGMSLSDFFMMLAKFFSFLDGVDENESKTNSSSNATTTDEVILRDNTSEHTTEIFYPVYDSEIIDNIGHRSRVLLSVEEKNMTEAELTHTEDVHIKDTTLNDSSKVTNITVDNSIVTSSNATKPSMDTILTNTNKDNNITDPISKNIVKRNADDTNLVFWNDMYDEEYGVNVDHLENNVRDKHSAKLNNIVKSSSVWLRDKVRKLTDNIRKKTLKENSYEKQKTSEGITKSRSTTIPNRATKKINKRDLKMMSEDVDGGRIDFAALTANMKDVCRKAAKAVEHTRNIEVREGSKESAVASSLMQQLVRLMTDLVDFQVQQKTCLKLPPDLQNFLEWLTGNDKTEDIKRGFDDVDNMLSLENIANYDKPTENYLELLTPVTEKDLQTLGRSDCLGTLHAVRDLMREYEGMGEEDKSKMTGIKEYLENQLGYLQNRLNSMDYYNTYQKTDSPIRFRRSLLKDGFKIKNSPRFRRNLRKYIKNSDKKHTQKTTTSINENSSLNDFNGNLKLRSNIVKTQSAPKAKKIVDENEKYFNERNKLNGRGFIENGKPDLNEVNHKVIGDTKKLTTVIMKFE